MKITLSKVTTKDIIEFVKQFSGLSDKLFLEIGPNYVKSSIASKDKAKIRFSTITHDKVIEEMSKEIDFRASFYSLSKFITGLGFEDKVDLTFELEERNGIQYALKMQIKGNKIKLNIPCTDITLDYVYLSDAIKERVLNLTDPINFTLDSESIKNIKNFSKFLGDNVFYIIGNETGVYFKFSDGEIQVSDKPSDNMEVCFISEIIGEFSEKTEYECSMEEMKLVLFDKNKDTTTILSRANVND